MGKQSYVVGIQFDLRFSGMLRRVHRYVVTDARWRGEFVASLSAQRLTGFAFGRRNDQEWHVFFGRHYHLLTEVSRNCRGPDKSLVRQGKKEATATKF